MNSEKVAKIVLWVFVALLEVAIWYVSFSLFEGDWLLHFCLAMVLSVPVGVLIANS